MDFSRYGVPSGQWRRFTKKYPSASRDGYDGNDPSAAARLRTTQNTAREQAAGRLMTTTGLHARVSIETIQVPSRDGHTVPIRRYTPRDEHGTAKDSPVILFFHGGGFLFGSETTDDVLCSTIAVEKSATVLSVIYRHTPEHKHPAQHNDAWDAFQFIRCDAKGLHIDITAGIGLMGVSAGSTLAAGVVLRHLAEARKTHGCKFIISGLVLSIPWLIHTDNYPFHLFASRDKSAKIQCKDTPVIPAARLGLFSDILGAQDVADPLLNVALTPESELQGWPRTAFLIAGMDPLRDDGLLFANSQQAFTYFREFHMGSLGGQSFQLVRTITDVS
ncbi:uncharacterized protein DNG_09477 [Cephalotrichum gorgonifer]|uniref:Alpha/beta hydrolase fold-3 domain-containing protein n=1 Tax=Cephalotrichum gorgonifer TaxID=2041049 RepID=A0AAE8N7N0_9PEZI|nr:uncharacterized protein DNG_09477 [Cephalotrichum gorgonifer]